MVNNEYESDRTALKKAFELNMDVLHNQNRLLALIGEVCRGIHQNTSEEERIQFLLEAFTRYAPFLHYMGAKYLNWCIITGHSACDEYLDTYAYGCHIGVEDKYKDDFAFIRANGKKIREYAACFYTDENMKDARLHKIKTLAGIFASLAGFYPDGAKACHQMPATLIEESIEFLKEMLSNKYKKEVTPKDREHIVKEGIAAIQRDVGFREFVRSCGNCAYCDKYDGDGSGYDTTYSFCGNPENEWKDAKPGEDCTWRIDNPWCSLCNKWEKSKREC